MKGMSPSEKKWLDGAHRLEEAALSAIYDAYIPALYRYTYRLLGGPQAAEGIVAETFYRLLRAISAGGGPKDHLRAYLYRVAHNFGDGSLSKQPTHCRGCGFTISAHSL